jgi:hypothetical protein
MRASIFIFIYSLTLLSCSKETNSKQLNEYFKLKVNGQSTSFGPGNAFTGGQFECAFLGDTALFIAVKYGFESAGFYIKGNNISDGTYTLDKTNQAWYSNPNDFKNYITDDIYRGTLTISKGVFQSYGSIPTLQGQFSFQVVDTTTGNVLNITNGQFLMERHTY